MTEPAPGLIARGLRQLDRFFGGSAFPLLGLSLLLSTTILALVLLLLPVSSGPMGAFAEDFRTWCFGAKPGEGVAWGYVAAAILSPAMLASFIVFIWMEPLRTTARAVPRHFAFAGLASLAFATAFGYSVSLMDRGRTTGELPFPGDALRTSIPAPSFALTDQDGQPVSLEALRGRVVLMTGIYSRCSATCPMIFAQAQGAVASLSEEERQGLSVVAVTIDPERDDVARMKDMAEGHSLAAPTWRLVTGNPGSVNDLLDHMGVERRRDPVTGVIDHANLFVLIDRQGRVAYRLSLGDQQQRWLASALRLLLSEGVSAL